MLTAITTLLLLACGEAVSVESTATSATPAFLGDYECVTNVQTTDPTAVVDADASVLVYLCNDHDLVEGLRSCAPAGFVRSETMISMSCPGDGRYWFEVWAFTPPA